MAEWHEKSKILYKGKVIFGFGLESNPRVITRRNENLGFFVPLCHFVPLGFSSVFIVFVSAHTVLPKKVGFERPEIGVEIQDLRF